MWRIKESNRMDLNKRLTFKSFLLLIPFLYFVEIILGGNGSLISIAGISIRKILFALTLISLSLYCILYIKRIQLTKLDIIILIFLGLNAIWVIIVPSLYGYGIAAAIADIDVLAILVLYFPLVLIIRNGDIDWNLLERIFIHLVLIIAMWHIIMYVFESLMPGIYKSYYESFLPTITFGLFQKGTVIYGYKMVRIIKTCTVYLIPAFFIIYTKRDKKPKHYIYLAIFILAFLTTMTRSILISVIVGCVLYLIPLNKKMLAKKAILVRAVSFSFVAIIFVVLNFGVIRPLSFAYHINTTVVDKNTETNITEEQVPVDSFSRISSSFDEDDIGNNLRDKQTDALLYKWRQRPFMGFGYGSYTEECIRSKAYPFLYEATFPALLMKVGIGGILVYLGLIISMVAFAYKNKYSVGDTNGFLGWLIACIAFALAVQTNPLLFTYQGITVILFFLLSIEDKDIKWEIRRDKCNG